MVQVDNNKITKMIVIIIIAINVSIIIMIVMEAVNINTQIEMIIKIHETIKVVIILSTKIIMAILIKWAHQTTMATDVQVSFNIAKNNLISLRK